MSWKAWVLVAGAIVFLLTSVRLHFLPGQFGDRVSFEFVAPWK
jgi:hypothetical protein